MYSMSRTVRQLNSQGKRKHKETACEKQRDRDKDRPRRSEISED